jgi:tight adherence protein C
VISQIMLPLLLGAAVFGACFLFLFIAPTSRRRRAVVATARRWVPAARRTKVRLTGPVFKRLAEAADRLGRRLASDGASHELQTRLNAGGLAGKLTAPMFAALRLSATVVAAALSLVLLATVGHSFWLLLVALTLTILAWVLPGTVVDRIAAARRDEIGRALPDALDLLAVTVEAGLGLYGAIARLVEVSRGALADEFALVLSELRVGQSSERALRSMATRLDTPEVTSFVRALIQGEKLGLSLATTLKNQANDVRNARRAITEERAGKAPVKMLFPTALFIFPALFIVILGPAAIALKQFL